ncbi:MAG: hypothetical protein OIF34_13670, partial [Porticoccaceae bacterium]|nr:hypothetical protein [Porticoccaceae bacterium]
GFSALIIGARFWLTGVSEARFFTIAWAFFLAGLITANAAGLGLIPTNTLTVYGYQIGSFIEVVLLSLALGERISHLQRHKQESRKQLLASQNEAIHHLRNYEDLYQNSNTGQFQIDSQGNFIKCNPAWRRIIGFNTPQQMQQAPVRFDQLFASPEDHQRLFGILADLGHTQGFI